MTVMYRVLIQDNDGRDTLHVMGFPSEAEYERFMGQLYKLQPTWSSPSSPRWRSLEAFTSKRGWREDPGTDTAACEVLSRRAEARRARGFDA